MMEYIDKWRVTQLSNFFPSSQKVTLRTFSIFFFLFSLLLLPIYDDIHIEIRRLDREHERRKKNALNWCLIRGFLATSLRRLEKSGAEEVIKNEYSYSNYISRQLASFVSAFWRIIYKIEFVPFALASRKVVSIHFKIYKFTHIIRCI